MPTEDEFYARLGERIAERRKSRGITQQNLAAAIGLSRTSVTNIESGKQPVQLYTLLLIAQVLKTNIGALLPELAQVSIPENLDIPARKWLAELLGEDLK